MYQGTLTRLERSGKSKLRGEQATGCFNTLPVMHSSFQMAGESPYTDGAIRYVTTSRVVGIEKAKSVGGDGRFRLKFSTESGSVYELEYSLAED